MFQLYALLLVVVQLSYGVRTDEAKYLLNIPYPHPPLLRWIMSQTEFLSFQEVFWRIIIATIVIQSVWIVRDMARGLLSGQRKFIMLYWLLSAAVLLQAGTIMMAPITAIQGLIFLWLLTRPNIVNRFPAIVSLFWLISLFTAYQAALYVPIVFILFFRSDISKSKKYICVGLPLLLLSVYTITNPLVVVSMFSAGSQNTSLPASQKLEYLFLLWAVGGSVVLSALGTVGMIVKKRWDLLFSMLLVCIYVLLSFRMYYAILFTPLFIAGALSTPRLLCSCKSRIFLIAFVALGMYLQYGPSVEPSAARVVSSYINGIDGTVLINGSYGHEWQYELRQPVRSYKEKLIEDASIIVCLEECEEIEGFSVLIEEPFVVLEKL
ncbi:hypothetical protein HN854_05240 [Candidatus Peregrinibacteria bacterium]|nr:hypothetical protein [Candidatus Peregrinibacteria bacterium]